MSNGPLDSQDRLRRRSQTTFNCKAPYSFSVAKGHVQVKGIHPANAKVVAVESWVDFYVAAAGWCIKVGVVENPEAYLEDSDQVKLFQTIIKVIVSSMLF